MAKPTLVFDPVNGYEDPSAFPNPANETETREQLNELPKQLRDFINDHLTNAVVSSDVYGLRIVSDSLQYSDAQGNWYSPSQSGHALLDEDGNALPQRAYLKFINMDAEDDPDASMTVLTARQGEPGQGFPEGGNEGELIIKNSSTDYDTRWGKLDLTFTNVLVSGVPTSNTAQEWDTSSEYLYHLDVSLLGVTANHIISNFIVPTSLREIIAPYVETISNGVRLFFGNNALVNSSIISISARVV